MSNRPLVATIPVTKHIKDEFDAAGDSQLLENSVNVISDRMLLHPEPLSDLTVLHASREKLGYTVLGTG
jgi:hypothetical protein